MLRKRQQTAASCCHHRQDQSSVQSENSLLITNPAIAELVWKTDLRKISKKKKNLRKIVKKYPNGGTFLLRLWSKSARKNTEKEL